MVPQDVGQALLESYSRILESLAFTVLSRIGDVLYADSVARNPSQATTKSPANPNPGNDNAKSNLMTLSDLLTWSGDLLDNDLDDSTDCKDDLSKDMDEKNLNVVTSKKASYVDSLGGARSPKERH